MVDLWRLAQVRQRELLEEAKRARLARKIAQRRRRKRAGPSALYP